MRRWCMGYVVSGMIGLATVAWAAPREAEVPLRDGRLYVADLSMALMRELHLPPIGLSDAQIDLNGLEGSRFVQALNQSLGEGCNITQSPTALTLHIDTEKLPHDWDSTKVAARVFTAVAAPEAAAKQARMYGLLLPSDLDESRPLVVLVHGLDCNRANWHAISSLLEQDGHQVAYFTYPSDQPLVDSARFFAQNISAVRETFPKMRLNILTHSMGAVVARAFIEGPDYVDGIDRLIMIAPPNHGSNWAKYRVALEIEEHYGLWYSEPDWSWTWMITDGLGEAGRDLKPSSHFLHELNDHPRREGVKYTIIAGNQHTGYRIAADWIDATDNWVPDRASHWWGIRQCMGGIDKAAGHFRNKTGQCDGPVAVESCQLEGVEDFVLVPADHTSIYFSVHGEPPAAWETVRDRLAQ